MATTPPGHVDDMKEEVAHISRVNTEKGFGKSADVGAQFLAEHDVDYTEEGEFHFQHASHRL